MSESSNVKAKRPLSPHLQVYKPQMTSMLSILHRMTGVALSLGFVVFIAWLAILALFPHCYDDFIGLATTIPGKIALVGWVWAVSYHLCTGFRHLIWDIGYGYEKESVTRSGYFILLISTILTGFLCLKAFGVFS